LLLLNVVITSHSRVTINWNVNVTARAKLSLFFLLLAETAVRLNGMRMMIYVSAMLTSMPTNAVISMISKQQLMNVNANSKIEMSLLSLNTAASLNISKEMIVADVKIRPSHSMTRTIYLITAVILANSHMQQTKKLNTLVTVLKVQKKAKVAVMFQNITTKIRIMSMNVNAGIKKLPLDKA
jgi:hypothetical protein